MMTVWPSARFSWNEMSVHEPRYPLGSVLAATFSHHAQLPAGQRLRAAFIHRREGLPAGDARRRATLYRSSACVVVTHQSLRAEHDLHFCKAAQRHHISTRAADIDTEYIVDRRAIFRFRLDLDLPGA